MACNKCGANISENAKFCGYCGSVVEKNTQENLNENIIEEDVVSNYDLGKTIRVEPIQMNDEVLNNIVQEEIVNPMVNNPEPTTKKKNTLVRIIVSVVLGILVFLLATVMLFMKSNNSLMVLQRAINNMYNKGETSSTIDAKITLGIPTGEGLTFSLTLKTEAKDKENYKTQLTLNRSLLSEEINIYSSVNKTEMMVYLESGLIDMLGMSSSIESTWLYYRFALDEIVSILPNENQEIDFSEILDVEHFKYIDTANNLKHYNLIIDQKLIDKAKQKLLEAENEKLSEIINSIEEIKNPVKIDFYITKSDELSKIELDMSEFLQDVDAISSFVISMEFRDMGNTKVNIPNEALNSTMDIETYISNNSINKESGDTLYADDYEFDLDF